MQQGKLTIPVLLFIIAVLRFPSESLRISFQLLAEVGTSLALAYLLWGINKWISMFIIVACFSSIFPQYDVASFLAYHAVFFGIIWYYIVYQKAELEHILNVLCAIALVNVLFLCLQFFGINLFLKSTDPDNVLKVGLMANPNETSALLALCFPAFLRKKVWLLIPFVILGLFLTRSFGGVIAVACGATYFMWWRVNRYFIVTVVTVGICLFLLVDTPAISNRLNAWDTGMRLYSQHFIFGSGIGHWKYIFVSILDKDNLFMETAHNEYVQGIFEMGIPFIIILIGFFISWIKRLKKSDDIFKVAAIIITINCFVNFPLHIAVTAYIILTWLALIDKATLNRVALRLPH